MTANKFDWAVQNKKDVLDFNALFSNLHERFGFHIPAILGSCWADF